MALAPLSRVLLAFLLAPWIVPFVFLAYAWITLLAASPLRQHDLNPLELTLGALFMFGPMSVTFAYCAELILGLPVWLILRRRHVASRVSYATAGAGMGLAVHLAMSFFAVDRIAAVFARFTDPSNPYLYICIAAGALSATFFHTILFFSRR
ncbi:MAG: hypothetical protein JNK48_18090 [Bryobacterales bacterium]|nr:hypothetical protein [Bryobacterales bacterium]